MTKKKKLFIGLITLALILYPDKVTCGTRANFTCATPPQPGKTDAIYYYEIQPIAISFIEILTQSNIKIYYISGHTD